MAKVSATIAELEKHAETLRAELRVDRVERVEHDCLLPHLEEAAKAGVARHAARAAIRAYFMDFLRLGCLGNIAELDGKRRWARMVPAATGRTPERTTPPGLNHRSDAAMLMAA